MAKHDADSDGESPHSKRRRLTQTYDVELSKPLKNLPSVQDINLLFADGRFGAHTVSVVKIFSSFLENISSNKNDKNYESKKAVLLKYLKEQVGLEGHEGVGRTPDLVKVWHASLQSNLENLFSSAAGTLALLLKTISRLHEFQDVGNSICRILLHADNLTLFKHGLGANRSREHLIAPCLRLLREIVRYDGGKSAKVLYRSREVTLQRFDTFLTIRSQTEDGRREERRRPSIRSVAIEYLMLNLALQGPAAKIFILSQQAWRRLLLRDLLHDPPGVVSRVLSVLKKDVAQDRSLPTWIINRVFDEWTLNHIAALYAYGDDKTTNAEKSHLPSAIDSLLHSVCASSDLGLIGRIKRDLDVAEEIDDSQADAQEGAAQDKHSRLKAEDLGKALRRITNLLRTLQSHGRRAQIELILSCFRSHPELVDPYYNAQKSTSFDPQITASGVGHAHFLFALVQEPLDKNLVAKCLGGDELSTKRILRFLLPPDLNRKSLTRSINQSSDLLTFVSLRIMVAAFQKILTIKHAASCQSTNEHPVEERLQNGFEALKRQFSAQCPEMKVVISAFRSCPEHKQILRQSIAQLLVLYFKAIPHFALSEELDVSISLSRTLAKFDMKDGKDGEKKFDGLCLESLIDVALCSPSTRWWYKPESMPLSVLCLLLRHEVYQMNGDVRPGKVVGGLAGILEDNLILLPDKSGRSLKMLTFSLEPHIRKEHEEDVYSFLDNCFQRLARKPTRYSEILKSATDGLKGSSSSNQAKIHLLAFTAVEQWPYLHGRNPPLAIEAITKWLYLFLRLCIYDGVDAHIVQTLTQSLEDKTSCEDASFSPERLTQPLDAKLQARLDALSDINRLPMEQADQQQEDDHEPLVPAGPPQEDDQHRGLTRWSREDATDALKEGYVKGLLLCLRSRHSDIRLQAIGNVRALTEKLKPSTYAEWQQAKIVLGEVIETAKEVILKNQLPSFVIALAAQLLVVIDDPFHFLYEKVNAFLNKGPRWLIERLPSFWLDEILCRPPTGEDHPNQALEWLLDTLIDGLLDAADMELYRQNNVFEKVLACTSTPRIPASLLEKILDLLFRCTHVTGSTTLITRSGILEWIAILQDAQSFGEDLRKKLETLRDQVNKTCDHEKTRSKKAYFKIPHVRQAKIRAAS